MKYIIFVFALFLGLQTWSQDLVYQIKGRITNQDLGSNEGGVTVSMVRNGSTIATTQTSSNGKYTLNATGPKDGKYEIVYSKPGMVTKKIGFDGSKMNEEDIPPGNEIPFPVLDLDLFAVRENIDFSFLNTEYVASFFWNDRKFALDFDRVASEKTKKKINDLLLKAEKDKAEAEMKYQAAIQAAAAAEAKKEYQEAINKYEEALTYKPTEQMPSDKIVELEALLQAQKQEELAQQQADAEYNNLINAANSLRDQDKLKEAVAKYQEALTKKNEQYPKDEITALNAEIAKREKEAANNAAYEEAIKKGDMFLKQKSLKTAIAKYEEAAQLKPSEQYPKDKLKEIEGMMKEQEEIALKKQKYEEAVKAADQLYDAENFAEAKAKYEEALTYESAATYPKERIKLCDEKIGEAEAEAKKAEEIAALLKDGNTALSQQKYEDAKGKFEGVLALEAGHPEATQKLAQIEQKLKQLAEEGAKQAEFDKLVGEGDAAAGTSKFDEAISKYQAAVAIMPSPEVEQKIKDVQAKKLAAEQAAEEAEKQAQFDKLVGEGDAADKSGKYDEAISKYQEAIAIMPSSEVDGKIAAVRAKKENEAQAAENKAKYEAAMSEGNTLMISGDLEGAKSKFQLASQIDPAASEPKNKINEINGLLTDQAARSERKAKYDAAISEADHHFNNAKWDEALKRYRDALAIENEDASILDGAPAKAQSRIAEIEAIIEKEKDDAATQKKIAGLLTEGNTLKNQKKWEPAKSKFEEVLAIDPSQPEALAAIEDINKELAALKSAEEKEIAFNELKDEGFALAAQEKYVEAKSKLQEALTLKDDASVRTKIAEIDDAISKMNAQAQLDDQYNNLLTQAETAESNDDLQGAIAKYEQAGVLKPSESLPKNKIAELKQRIQQNANQAQIDADYRAAMKRGDDLMAQEKYLDAIKEYNAALTFKPNEQEPVDKAAEAARLEQEKGQEVDAQYEKILTVAQKKIDEKDYDKAVELANRALGLKPTDPRPQALLDKVELLKGEEAAYNKLIAEAQALEASKKYVDAKMKYSDALKKKPEEQMPKDKIAELQKIIDDMASSAQSDALYTEYMSNGVNEQNKKNYQKALSEYQNALSVKPGDKTAQNKIDEIQQILDDIANANAAELEKKNEFDRLVKAADIDFNAESYLEAKAKYEAALKIDPSSSYVKQQIDECVKLEREKGNVEAEREYRKIINAADKNFDKASYDKAKDYYTRALSLKSSDPYPKQKLAEIEAILNPSTIASAELEPLGEEFSGSVLDGMALLEKAEAERKALKGTQIKTGIDGIQEAESQRTLEKTQDHYDNSNEIYMVQQKITRDAGESDLGRQETVEALKKSEFERLNAEKQNQTFEYNENLSDQDMLYVVDTEVAMDYGERHSVYSDNADLMETYNTAQAERIRIEVETDKDRNIATDQDLTVVKLQIDDGVRDDYAERAEVRKDVERVEKQAVNILEDKSAETHDKALSNKNEVRKIELAYEEKSVEDARKSSDNNEELKVVRDNVVNEDGIRNDLKETHLQKTDREIAEVKEYIRVEEDGLEENRKNNAEVIKEGNKELMEAHYHEYNDELEKYVSNKERIEGEVEKNNGVLEKAEASHEKKVAYVEKMDKRAHIDAVDGAMSDEAERLNAKDKIENVYTNVQETAKEEIEKKEGNATNLQDVTKTIQANASNQTIGEQEKHYDAASAISKVDDTPGKKVVVENELGQEYPEGVSQESFTQKDENGLMTAVITRRIVVVEGHADVYVRTQTLHGITYTKNDKPSLQHVWNKETQGPHLERHY